MGFLEEEITQIIALCLHRTVGDLQQPRRLYYCWWYPLRGKEGCEDMEASSTCSETSRARRGWRTSFSRLGLSSLTGSGPCPNLSQSLLQHTGPKDRDAAWESVQEMCLVKTARPRRIWGCCMECSRPSAMQQVQTLQEIRPSVGSPSHGQSHGRLLASAAQPFSGTASGAIPRALCNAPAIYMCYKSQEQIGQVA